ncbi:hypothetical protein MLD38_003481 [Melastoma candidum]|uniref:Uncharacterized protein n=1 Tax=Melastoma candidum TaxID=119954 RepID=A0ACB9S6K4_9MYRT|nr:hypothetical protein MLD38_003481 [Melastoma candidum]
MLVPPWLESLLSTPFFSVCPSHRHSPRNECNMYCLDCNGPRAFCYNCRSSCHKDHHIIQIRRSSYHDVVRVSEIQQVLDIGGVQTYVINSTRVVFLNERPVPRVSNGNSSSPNKGSGVSHVCELKGIKREDGHGRFSKRADHKERIIGMSLSSPCKGGGEEEASSTHEGNNNGFLHAHPTTPRGHSPPSANPRRRKGVPRRAPS